MQAARDLGFAMVIAALSLAVSGGATLAAGWTKAAFRGEENRTAQGCADRFTEDSYVCAYVRCDPKGELALYLAAPGPDVPGKTELDIDGRRFVVAMAAARETSLPYVKRAAAMPPGLLDALKTGRTIRFSNTGFAKGYDVIRLTNAGPAIRRVEKICMGRSGRSGIETRWVAASAKATPSF